MTHHTDRNFVLTQPMHFEGPNFDGKAGDVCIWRAPGQLVVYRSGSLVANFKLSLLSLLSLKSEAIFSTGQAPKGLDLTAGAPEGTQEPAPVDVRDAGAAAEEVTPATEEAAPADESVPETQAAEEAAPVAVDVVVPEAIPETPATEEAAPTEEEVVPEAPEETPAAEETEETAPTAEAEKKPKTRSRRAN